MAPPHDEGMQSVDAGESALGKKLADLQQEFDRPGSMDTMRKIVEAISIAKSQSGPKWQSSFSSDLVGRINHFALSMAKPWVDGQKPAKNNAVDKLRQSFKKLYKSSWCVLPFNVIDDFGGDAGVSYKYLECLHDMTSRPYEEVCRCVRNEFEQRKRKQGKGARTGPKDVRAAAKALGIRKAKETPHKMTTREPSELPGDEGRKILPSPSPSSAPDKRNSPQPRLSKRTRSMSAGEEPDLFKDVMSKHRRITSPEGCEEGSSSSGTVCDEKSSMRGGLLESSSDTSADHFKSSLAEFKADAGDERVSRRSSHVDSPDLATCPSHDKKSRASSLDQISGRSTKDDDYDCLNDSDTLVDAPSDGTIHADLLDRLLPGRWLNDKAIEEVLRGFNPKPMTIYAAELPLHDIKVLEKRAVIKHRRLSQNHEKVVLAPNLNENHWVLIVIDRKTHEASIYDPLHVKKNIKQATEWLKLYLAKWEDISSGEGQGTSAVEAGYFQIVEHSTNLRQSNFVDCGIYCLVVGICAMCCFDTPDSIDPLLWRYALSAGFSVDGRDSGSADGCFVRECKCAGTDLSGVIAQCLLLQRAVTAVKSKAESREADVGSAASPEDVALMPKPQQRLRLKSIDRALVSILKHFERIREADRRREPPMKHYDSESMSKSSDVAASGIASFGRDEEYSPSEQQSQPTPGVRSATNLPVRDGEEDPQGDADTGPNEVIANSTTGEAPHTLDRPTEADTTSTIDPPVYNAPSATLQNGTMPSLASLRSIFELLSPRPQATLALPPSFDCAVVHDLEISESGVSGSFCRVVVPGCGFASSDAVRNRQPRDYVLICLDAAPESFKLFCADAGDANAQAVSDIVSWLRANITQIAKRAVEPDVEEMGSPHEAAVGATSLA